MNLRKALLIAAGVVVVIGLAAMSLIAIVGGLVLAVLVRFAMKVGQSGAEAEAAPLKDENGMIDITAKGKVL